MVYSSLNWPRRIVFMVSDVEALRLLPSQSFHLASTSKGKPFDAPRTTAAGKSKFATPGSKPFEPSDGASDLSTPSSPGRRT